MRRLLGKDEGRLMNKSILLFILSYPFFLYTFLFAEEDTKNIDVSGQNMIYAAAAFDAMYKDQEGSVEIVNLSSKRLREIPLKVWSCVKVKELNLSENELENIPSDIKALTILEKLDLHGNKKLIDLPVDVLENLKISEINVQGCKLLLWDTLLKLNKIQDRNITVLGLPELLMVGYAKEIKPISSVRQRKPTSHPYQD